MDDRSSEGGLLRRRLSRRSALRGAAVGGFGLASLSLIACSGDDPTVTASPTATATYLSGSPSGESRNATYFPPASAVATAPKRHSRNIDQPIRNPSHGPPARSP